MGAERRLDEPPGRVVPRRYPSVEAALSSRARQARKLRPVLERMLAERDPALRLEADPVSFVHRYESVEDRELVGLLASSLAYGNVKVIRSSVEKVLALLEPSPAAALTGLRRRELERLLSGFVHRFTRGPDVAALLHGAQRCQVAHGGLGELFLSCLKAEEDLRGAVGRFVHAVRISATKGSRSGLPPGLPYLLPDGSGPGACKRLHMFLRWMVRGPDGVDLGLWKGVPSSILLVPLDTHTGRICRYLGLTGSATPSWAAAEEVTWHLRGIDPADPARYDFALAHLGISGDCRHRRASKECASCALAEVCGL